jgi:hypothetical protein
MQAVLDFPVYYRTIKFHMYVLNSNYRRKILKPLANVTVNFIFIVCYLREALAATVIAPSHHCVYSNCNCKIVSMFTHDIGLAVSSDESGTNLFFTFSIYMYNEIDMITYFRYSKLLLNAAKLTVF